MFICCICEKPIEGMSVVVDATHIAHFSCAKFEKEMDMFNKLTDLIDNGGVITGDIAKELFPNKD